ncbi:unnamed protein product [Alternaria alternata]
MSPKHVYILNTLPSISTAANANADSGGTPSPIDFISGQEYAPLPVVSPKTHKPRRRQQPFYRGKGEVKRAVTCPNLRAILADEACPKEWSKAAD